MKPRASVYADIGELGTDKERAVFVGFGGSGTGFMLQWVTCDHGLELGSPKYLLKTAEWECRVKLCVRWRRELMPQQRAAAPLEAYPHPQPVSL